MDSPHRLLIDNGSEVPRWAHGRDADVLVVPQGQSSLRAVDGGSFSLHRGRVAVPAGAVRFDVVDGRRLVMATSPDAEVGLNGRPAPRLTLLASADRIDLPAGPTLHVARERCGDPVAVPSELVGEACGYCRVPVSSTTRVWICGDCGTPMHLEPEDVPEARRLTCALHASACNQCHGSIDFGTGLDHVPC